MAFFRISELGSSRSSLPAALLGLVLLATACGNGGGPARTEIPSAPHPIIVIDIDSLRADHLGCYGYQRATSPNIDALAAESLRFTWAFAQAPNTAPSQASILSSLYPSTHGMVDETNRLPDEVVTLAEALSAGGYTTAAFVDGGYLSEAFGFAQGFDHFDNSRGAGLAEVGPKALEWLRGHAGESFFLLVHTYDTHVPYAPPAEQAELFTADLEPPTPGFVPDPEQMEAARTALRSDPPQAMPANDLAYATALYDAEIRTVDVWIGELLAEIRSLGLDSKATIVLVSDHGEELQEHGDLLHESIHTTVTRIPLLMRLPGGIEAGVVSKNVESIDLMPTLLELAGQPVPAGAQGASLLAMVRGESAPPYLAFSESTFFGGQQAVAMAGYRLILSEETDTAELYNLLEDPLELQDLAADEQRVQTLRQRLGEWQEMVEAAAVDGSQGSDVDAETLEQLKGLGYIQ